MASQQAPFYVISENNHGPLITLVSVSFMIAAAIFVAAKFGSVIYFKQRRTAVNTPIWVALVLAIVQVVVMQKAIECGLGQHRGQLTQAAVEKSSKFMFAAQLLVIAILSLSKQSTILLIWKLTPNQALQRSCVIALGATIAWTIFAVFAISFQCGMPELWIYTPERCTGQGALMYPISIAHILIEITLVVLPFVMMRSVQMVWRKRVKILCSFAARGCVAGIGIAQLALLPSVLRSSDVPWDIVNWTICGQAMMCTTIIMACVPTLYHIFAGLHSGLITTRVPDSVELTRPSKGSTSINQSTMSGSRARESLKEKRRRDFYTDIAHFDHSDSAVVTDITSSPLHNGDLTRRSCSSEGTESTKHLTQEMKRSGVMKTVDITVEVDHR